MKKVLPLVTLAAGIVLVFKIDLQGNPNKVYHIDIAESESNEHFIAEILYDQEDKGANPDANAKAVDGVERVAVSIDRSYTRDFIVRLTGNVTHSFKKDDKHKVSTLKGGQLIRAKVIKIGHYSIKDKEAHMLCRL